MRPPRARTLAALLAAASLLFLAACAATPGAGPGARPDVPVPAPGKVVAQGMVIGSGDGEPRFCLGAIRESYPPQCDGVPIVGWDWDKVDGSETSGDTTWGMYAVWGTWNGAAYTVEGTPMMLALYDPMPVPDPRQWDPAAAGDSSEEELARIQEEILKADEFELLTMGPVNGYLFVTVVYDNGDLQRHLTKKYGPDVVEVRSAITPVPGS